MPKHIALILLLITLTSCHTALQVSSVPRQIPQKEQANMEFIGFKNLNKNNIMFKDFGAELERCNIAYNRQDFYMGLFSLQELEAYKSSCRYITFVDVRNHIYNHNDAINDNSNLEFGGWVVAGITVFTLIPVYVPMLCAADKNQCQMTLKGEYSIYVYDTQEKQLAFTLPFEINESDLYRGEYSHKKTDQRAVNDRYKNILFNTFLDFYAQTYNHVNTLPK